MDERTRQLRRAFRYLKRGVFPPESINELTFGRNAELRLIQSCLDTVEGGSTRHVFLEGTYGHGKSHVLKALEAMALEQRFAISWVTLDGYSHAFNHPTRYFHSLLENLRVPGMSRRGLNAVVTQWLRGPERASVIAWTEGALTSLAWSIRASHRMREVGGQADWDAGYYMESRDIANKSGKAHFDVVSQRMQDVASLMRAVGLNGLVFLFDELETVATLLWGIRQRFLSYEFLNLLVDGRRHPHCFFAFAITPDFELRVSTDRVQSDYYAADYPGASRFIQKWHESALNVVRLRKLDSSDLLELCKCLRDLHADAFSSAGYRRLPDKLLGQFVDNAQRRSLGVREVVRALVHLLEVLEQHRDSDVVGALRGTLEVAAG